MRYKLTKGSNYRRLNVEASFTLIDFMVLFACFLLGIFFALFLWMFAAAVFIKLFTSHDFEFDTDSYQIKHYIRVFSYFRFSRRTISFGEVQQMLLSNQDSGKALGERGLTTKEWYTLDIETKDRPIRIARVEKDELEELHELFLEIEELYEEYFQFQLFVVEV
tara:strand:- start:6425 stop:6916 length:492 start_codon:yes stop_codon:yes gene_type:complete